MDKALCETESTQDYETYVDDVSDNKRLKSQEDTTNCITSNMTYL